MLVKMVVVVAILVVVVEVASYGGDNVGDGVVVIMTEVVFGDGVKSGCVQVTLDCTKQLSP